jgi:pyrimidine operon attenuation protein / uracil phosphoribosyltransferase
MILSKEIAQKKIRRMAMELAERNHDKPSLILIGIKENGMVIATKIESFLKEVFDGPIQLLSLSIDKKNPSEILLSEWPDFNDATIVLIDDVANTGRTMLYALKPLLEQHPSSIQTLALLERTYKQFPVSVDYVGHSVATAKNEMIVVEVSGGEVQGAYLQGRNIQ